MDHDFEFVGAVTAIQIIAIKRRIREIENLQKLFGPARWRKLKGIAVVKFPNGVVCRVEVHWYEAHGIGRRKIKVKRILEWL